MENGLKWVLLSLIASGCQFSSGAEDTDTDGDTEADTEAVEIQTGGPGATTAPATSTGSTTAGTSTSGTPSTSTSAPTTTDEGDTTSTGSEPACDPFAQWLWATDVPDEDTTFAKTESPILPLIDKEQVVFLRSIMANQGTAALSFEVPCSDDVILWALTWDAAGTVDNSDAFQVGLNQDTKQVADSGTYWEYGCDNEQRRWAWYRVRDTGRACEPGGELEPTLDAGEHHLQINNVGPVSGGPEFDFAGLAALVVTNDPDYDPSTEYDPNPGD
ncbi:MAG: hypothetical protein ACRBN8_29230 [Nannocystales bacterium]